MPTGTDQLATRLRRVIDEGNDGEPSDLVQWKEGARMVMRSVYGEEDNLVKRFDQIRYRPSASSPGMPLSASRNAFVAGVREALAMLSAALEDVETRDPEPPRPSVSDLHPWVSGTAATMWNNGQREQALREAVRNVEVQLKTKLAVDGTATDVVGRAFSTNLPKAGQPRLRFRQFKPETDSWRNAHDGALQFGQGCMKRIRNLVVHEEQELNEQETLESLVALSLLARWIDEADIESVS